MQDEGRATADGGEATAQSQLSGGDADRTERIADGFVTLGPDWTVVDANGAAEALLDAPASGLVGATLAEAFPDGRRLRDRLEEVQARGEAATVETRDADRDRWLELRAYPAGDELSAIVREATESTRAGEELRASRRFFEQLHDIATDPGHSPPETVELMLAAARDRLGVELGFLTRIEDGTQSIVEMVGEHPELEQGASAPLSEAYCRHTVGREEPLGVTHAREEGWADDPAYERFGLGCYLGATIAVDGQQFGTVCFADTDPRAREFSALERTFVDLLTDWISYILEQRRYEERVRKNRRRLETVIENMPVVVFALDSDGTFTLSEGRGLEQVGLEPGELTGESVFDYASERPEICEHVSQALDGQETRHTVEMGSATFEHWYQPVFEDGEVTQVVGAAHDVTELTEHREQLSGLLETTQSLMQARSRQEVADIVTNAARDVLGYDANVVRLYDADAERLEPAARATAQGVSLADRPTYDMGAGMPGRVFATGESRVIDDLDAVDTGPDGFRSAMYYPMGVHGTVSVASAEPGAFEETDEQVLALLATAAAAACTRARRERQVREARERVEALLERIEGIVENTVEVLVGATTREELERGVVTELAATEPYTFAWIGRPDVTAETLSPTEWDGEAPVPAADLTVDLGGTNPVASALADGEPRIVTAGDAGAGELGCGGDGPETVMLVPLAYRDTTYGMVGVFADRSGAFDEREQLILSVLGRAVANAINAIERGRILDADEIIELELAIDDPDLLFSHLADACGSTVEVADFDYRSDGRLRLYLSADADGEQFASLAAAADTVDDTQLIADGDDGCLLELTLRESLVGRLTEFGAVVRDLVAVDGSARVTVELPYEAEARELFELVEERHPATELVAYHEHERPVRTRQEFRSALADRFTDRQETALRTAFLGGFFDWPRDIDGNDLAGAMDISRPTYHQHLRAAQRKVFEELFE